MCVAVARERGEKDPLRLRRSRKSNSVSLLDIVFFLLAPLCLCGVGGDEPIAWQYKMELVTDIMYKLKSDYIMKIKKCQNHHWVPNSLFKFDSAQLEIWRPQSRNIWLQHVPTRK